MKNTMRPRFFALLAALLLLPAPAIAQPSAKQVLKQSRDQLEARMDGVDNFVVENTVSGLPTSSGLSTTTYYQRAGSGNLAFRSHTKVQGANAPQVASGTQGRLDILSMSRKLYDYFGDSAQYQGTETVDGEETHVLLIEDMSPLYEDMRGSKPQAGTVQARNARVYIDADEGVPRKMSANVNVSQGKQQRTMKMTTLLEDYRAAQQSMLYPYRTIVQMDYQMSEQEKTQMKQRLQQATSMMQQMPEEQRARMKKQLAAMRTMLENDGKTELTMQTQNVQVNTELPDGVFGE